MGKVSQWVTQYIPLQIEPQKRNITRKRLRYNNLGIAYPAGMGCTRASNCFQCPESECHFGEVNTNADYKFIADPGDGIKP